MKKIENTLVIALVLICAVTAYDIRSNFLVTKQLDARLVGHGHCGNNTGTLQFWNQKLAEAKLTLAKAQEAAELNAEKKNDSHSLLHVSESADFQKNAR